MKNKSIISVINCIWVCDWGKEGGVSWGLRETLHRGQSKLSSSTKCPTQQHLCHITTLLELLTEAWKQLWHVYLSSLWGFSKLLFSIYHVESCYQFVNHLGRYWRSFCQFFKRLDSYKMYRSFFHFLLLEQIWDKNWIKSTEQTCLSPRTDDRPTIQIIAFQVVFSLFPTNTHSALNSLPVWQSATLPELKKSTTLNCVTST